MSIVTSSGNLDRFQVAVDAIGQIISIRGLGTERTDGYTSPDGDSAGTTTFTSLGSTFQTDSVVAGDILTIISDPADDGLIIGHYRVLTIPTETTITLDRSIPNSTAADLTFKVSAKQTTGLVAQQVADGVDMNTLYIFLKFAWRSLAAGLGNAVDLNQFSDALQAISSNAGEYIMGGINNQQQTDFTFADDNGVEASDSEGQPRELIRDGGWQEVSSTNIVIREYPNYKTLGALDADAQATLQTGDETGTPLDFKLPGPVNQAVLMFGPDVGPDITATGFTFAATTITRNDGGNWATSGYRIGDYVQNRSCEDGANDGNYGPITAVDNSADGAITIASASFTVNADDTTSIFQVDHRRYGALRVRKKGRVYAISLFVNAGITTTNIQPIVNKFPLSHTKDPAIVDDDGTVSGGDGTANGDTYQNVETHTTGIDGVTTDLGDGSFTLDSVAGGFQGLARTLNVLQVGDSVELTGGTTYLGVFEVKAIVSDTELTLFHEIYDSTASNGVKTYPGDETSLDFTVRTGIRDTGHATNGTLADIDGDTGTFSSATSTFDADTAIGDRLVVANDILELISGTGDHVGYYKVISVTNATTLVINTSDQIFTVQSDWAYKIWQPGMFLQRFETTAVAVSMTNAAFADANPDTLTRTGGSWVTDLFLANMVVKVLGAEDAPNITSFTIGDTTPSATVMTFIASDAVVANATDTVALNGNITGDIGIVRTVNGVKFTYHWRLFSNGGSQAQVFQFLQRELRRATDIDGGVGLKRGDITDLLMNFVSPNGVTLDLFPDDLATNELNNVKYKDIAELERENAFLVGVTFDVNDNLISSEFKRLTVYFTSVPTGDFDSNTTVVVDDKDGVDMSYTTINADIQTTFDYTNNSQGGRTPDTDAAITVIATGSDLAQHILVTQTIGKVNSVVVSVPAALERNG